MYNPRNLASLKENWAQLRKNRKGEVIRVVGDFATRKGQCLEPVSVVDMFPFTVTHKVGENFKVPKNVKTYNEPTTILQCPPLGSYKRSPQRILLIYLYTNRLTH